MEKTVVMYRSPSKDTDLERTDKMLSGYSLLLSRLIESKSNL